MRKPCALNHATIPSMQVRAPQRTTNCGGRAQHCDKTTIWKPMTFRGGISGNACCTHLYIGRERESLLADCSDICKHFCKHAFLNKNAGRRTPGSRNRCSQACWCAGLEVTPSRIMDYIAGICAYRCNLRELV